MRWDSARPVPWRRFLKEGLVFGLVMAGWFAVTGDARPGTFLGVGIGATFYVLISAFMAKLGHVRTTMKEMRAAAALAQQAKAAQTGATPAGRPRPAPTSRTGGGTAKKRK